MRTERCAPDRAAIMQKAWRQWRYARSRGWHIGEDDPWTWPRCLRLAQAQERARRLDSFAAVEQAMRALVAQGAARI